MRAFSVSWNGNTDITRVKFTDEFENSSWIVQADVLSDAIYYLQEAYNMSLPSHQEKLNSKKFLGDDKRKEMALEMAKKIVKQTSIEEFIEYHVKTVLQMYDEYTDEMLLDEFNNFKPTDYQFEI